MVILELKKKKKKAVGAMPRKSRGEGLDLRGAKRRDTLPVPCALYCLHTMYYSSTTENLSG